MIFLCTHHKPELNNNGPVIYCQRPIVLNLQKENSQAKLDLIGRETQGMPFESVFLTRETVLSSTNQEQESGI